MAIRFIKEGLYKGQPVQFSDGPVSKALKWESFKDIMHDNRPVVIDMMQRMVEDHDPMTAHRLMHDVENLEYIHIMHGDVSLGHVFHVSEIEES